ncbi:pilus assembly protein [Sulfitobacter sp. D35]|uniref:TadE/TadG family type IV pilus assembly protein n=1 Tax=Sulfitobacter sp. D35 TaxID=3083252 RepID=UPI00296E4DFE|nr:TadE family protein [Sulfitobacter sp. D35]MDW4497022.1 pilus assembly protein [Sulfitobacter sp. D35]
MMRAARRFAARFRDDENGQILVEFVVMVPLVFTIFMTSVEMGVYSYRQVFLDRGLDLAVRDIRLSTGNTPKHDEIKARICEYSGFLAECERTLRLEMTPMNVRGFSGLADDADCVDISADPEPPRKFEPGADHQLMLLRACYRFDPVFPTTGLGRHYGKDGAGKATMIALAAFVQEPE